MNRAKTNFEPIWVAGFMSGTSLDAVDGALILTDGQEVLEFGPAIERKYTAAERTVLQAATQAARDWNWQGQAPNFSAALEVITQTHAEAFEALMSSRGAVKPHLVGIHGQTVLHRRAKGEQIGATLQLIDAPSLCARLSLPLAYDFRSADIEAGGQGAPLAPAYHGALLMRGGRTQEAAAVLNLGGVANITVRGRDGSLLAFDTGPANGPIDEWVEAHGHGSHDAGGAFAAAGRANEGLILQWLDAAWFSEAPPKSLDRYDFSAAMARGLSIEDGAATLTAFSARAVAAGLEHISEVPERVIVCGGGRHNPALMQALAQALPCEVLPAEAAGWRGDSIEAEAFAYLAARTLRGLPLSWPGTTGVGAPCQGGRLILPNVSHLPNSVGPYSVHQTPDKP